MVALANVALTDTFDVWRTRTNQIIIKLDQLETSDAASYDKANSANLVASSAYDKANAANSLAFNTGIGANAYAAAIGTAANSYMITTQNGSNTAVGTGANAYAAAIGTAANSYMITTQNGSNTAVGTGANAYAAAIGTAGNTYFLTTLTGANTAVGTGANTVGIAAFAKANAANISAGAAFDKANVAGGFMPVLSDVVNVTRYIPFMNTATGNAYSMNVSTSQLTFNPSSNTLTTNNINVIASIGVGTAPSGTVGEIRATNDITAYYSSDMSLKTNINNIPNALDKVMQIRGVGFDWKDSYMNERGGEDGYFVRKRDVGIIAQEIEKVLPEVVATRDNGIKAVRYEKLVALLIEAIKELNDKIEKK